MVSLKENEIYAVLPSSDYERAKKWYSDKLGMTPDEEQMSNGWYRCANGTWFVITSSQYAGTAQNTAAGFTVTNIEEVMDDLRSQGVEFLEYDMGEMGKTENGLFTVGPYKAAWFKDSEGNILEISEVAAG